MLARLLGMIRSREGRDTILTYAAEGLSLVGVLLAYRFAKEAGKDEFDLYVIVRRTISFISPLILVGAVVGLTRFVAMEKERSAQVRYLRGALSWVLPIMGLLLIVGFCLPDTISWPVFGSSAYAALVPPLALMVAGISLHSIAYAFLRGQHRMVLANGLQVLALAIVPCVAFLVFHGLREALWAMGVAWMVASTALILYALIGTAREKAVRERWALLRYGLPRLPGDMALGGLLALPVYVVALSDGLSESGALGFGATLLNLAATVFSPLALLLLPRSSAQLAAGDHSGLSERIRWSSLLTLGTALGITVLFELLADP
ncbi:MAG: hypothetical protein QM724_08065 [Flavobacteriales bacterium]